MSPKIYVLKSVFMQIDGKIYKQKANFKEYFAEFIEKEKLIKNLLTKHLM
jgi:hypothetical protein